MGSPVTNVHRTKQNVGSEPVFQNVKLYSSANAYHYTQADEARLQQHLVGPARLAKRRYTLAPAEGWGALLLLAVALYSVVVSIISVNWVDNSSLLLCMPVCGLLVGLVIAKIPRFPQSILHLAACLIGHWLAVWLTSSIAFHIPWIQVLAALRAAFSGETVRMGMFAGKIVFFFYLSFLCFFLGYFGCWLIYRAHLPWLLALVYGSIMLVNLNYLRREMDFLIVVLLGSLLLLIARMSLTTQIVQWKREGLRTDQRWLRSVVQRCMLVACVISLLALLSSSYLPMLAQPKSGQMFWSRLEIAWNNLITGHLSWQDVKALSPFDQSFENFFDDQLTITESVQLPAGEILNYTDTSNSGQSGSQPHYLEGLTYNLFDGRQWRSNLSNSRSYGPGELLPIDFRGNNVMGAVTVTITEVPAGDKHYIFSPEQPLSFSIPTQLSMDGTVGAWAQQNPLYSGEKYNVAFIVPTTDPKILSQVPFPGNNQRVWNTDQYYTKHKATYLQVPGDLSPNVAQTARQWTKGANNTYTAMKTLEQALSDTSVFTYSLQNQPIPPHKDVVDWLLETRRGYCTYYATTMAIMGRQLGIPTRVVSGFSQGRFDQQRKVWVVNGTDAHSWVQVYFPKYGWISFDPTPTFAPNAAPLAPTPATPLPTATHSAVQPMPQFAPTQGPKAASTTTIPATSSNASARTTPEDRNQDLRGITIAVIVISLLLGLVILVRHWWYRLYEQSTLASVLFWRFCQTARWVGLGPKAWQTPYEYSSMLSRQFPEQAVPLTRLTKLFVRERWGPPQYTPHKLESADVISLRLSLRSIVLSRFAQLLRSLQMRNMKYFLQKILQLHGK